MKMIVSISQERFNSLKSIGRLLLFVSAEKSVSVFDTIIVAVENPDDSGFLEVASVKVDRVLKREANEYHGALYVLYVVKSSVVLLE